MGRPRKAGKRTKSGRLIKAVEPDAREVVLAARRRVRSGHLLDLEGGDQKFRDATSAPLTAAIKRDLLRLGDRLFDLQAAGSLSAEQVAAGHDFAARYDRYARLCGIPPRTAKVGGYGAVRGAPMDVDPEVASRAKMVHFADVAAIAREAEPGSVAAIFAVSVEDRRAPIRLVISALDALINFHGGR